MKVIALGLNTLRIAEKYGPYKLVIVADFNDSLYQIILSTAFF